MKISYNWLKQYMDVSVDPNNIAQLLTDCGLEVDGMEQLQTIKGGLEGLVVGEVLSKEKHPDADRLNLTTVDVGNGEPLSIVCGAPNVEKGQKVIVATVGAILYPISGEPFKIKKSKIRGELSEGMICAEDEIGLGKSHEGIMVLKPDTKIGTLAKDYFKVEDDYVFEIGLTPNRADATGHIGVARDVVAVIGLTKKINLIKPSIDRFKVDNTNLTIKVEVEDHDLCPRYSGVTLSGMEVKESPEWLKNRLVAIGLTPINNIVDVTNFVLHETGQPLHAFDAAKIKGNKVVIRKATANSTFITLDGVERKLSADDLMICNSEKEMCIAGVFGGLDSGVSETTTTIFLESAYFNPGSIRKSAKRHGLNTDASFRFERGADPNITIFALKRAANLIKEVAGGSVSSEIVDVYPKPIKNFDIDFSYQNCDTLIGKSIDRNSIKSIIQSLEIDIIKENKDGLSLSVPPFKVDVQREVDVIEEVLRIYGYNNVEIPEMMQTSLSYRVKPEKEKVTNVISDWLVANGFNEILSNSLTKSSYYDSKDKLVKIQNPLSKELDAMRQTMIFNGLETIVYNQNRRSGDLKLFEWGATYFKTSTGFREESNLSLFVSGRKDPENWNTDNGEVDFYYINGMVKGILEKFGIDKLNVQTSETDLEQLDYGLNFKVNNTNLVELGKISQSIQAQFDIDKEVYFAVFNYNELLKLSLYNTVNFKEIPKYPVVRRDLALLLDKEVSYQNIKEIAIKQENKLLKSINLFDVYEGKNLGEGKKSYAVSFKFQDHNKTLTDTQVDQSMEKIIRSLTSELKATLR